MIYYKSTRGNKKEYTFSQAVLKGIADDGGLLVPNSIPTISRDQLERLLTMSYAKRALYIMKLFQTDFSENVLGNMTRIAYGKNFDKPEIVPLIHLKNMEYILELFHGPTWAFKDIALQIMPLFFSEAAKMDNAKREKRKQKKIQYLILVATSGDTGKAALEGYKNKENVSIIVFFPDKRVSSIQELSMITQGGNNVGVYPLYGDFDEVQSMVKILFSDKKFTEKLHNDFSVALSSANSINWGRLLPQIVYHISGYIDLVSHHAIKLGDPIDIAVPTGNFGSMLSAYFVKKMGLPINKLIAATNENNIVSDFLQTGIFDISKRSMIATPAPAMDILIPSNIERLLFLLTNDSEKVAAWMHELKESKKFVVDEVTKKELQKVFYVDWVRNEDCLKTIKNTLAETGYLLDPHTAIVKEVVNRYKKKGLSNVPIILCSTAHWAKFPHDINNALNGVFIKSDDNNNEFRVIAKILKKVIASYVPKSLWELKNLKAIHSEKADVKKEEVEKLIISFLKNHI